MNEIGSGTPQLKAGTPSSCRYFYLFPRKTINRGRVGDTYRPLRLYRKHPHDVARTITPPSAITRFKLGDASRHGHLISTATLPPVIHIAVINF
ncbi:hypothetical protein J6590_004564 [Homalodisca vitripennis]|nr:hypothetical protein J6590_004564 [Homalodisca vitripennis]